MFIAPECEADCLTEAARLLDKITFEMTKVHFAEGKLSKILPNSFAKVEDAISNSVRDAVKSRISLAAAKNKNESVKLSAFIAGDTLAEILLSQAFLTPSVREAAARTLNNMVNDIPPPPQGPPAQSQKEQGAARA